MFRSVARWFVVVVLALDAVAAFVVIGGSLLQAEPTATPAVAATSTLAPATASAPAPAPVSAPASAEAKPAPLTTPAETIPGALNPDAPVTEAKPASTSAPAAKAAPKSEAFLRLLHAYENMEPESAAKAVAQLAAKDKEAVVQMLLGWKPRTSGQILDALTQFNPTLAADLSYEVWKRSGVPAS